MFQEKAGALDINDELTILRTFHFDGVNYSDGVGNVKSIMQLIQFADYIDNINKVCEQYQLEGCLRDSKMEALLIIHDMLISEKTKDELTAAKSQDYLIKIYEILGLNDQRLPSLKLFALIRDSAEFYQFLKEKNYREAEGMQVFQQQHTLITQHLQHEEYNEQVLTHLMVAFRYIFPFLDTKQNLQQLMEQVYNVTALQIEKGYAADFIQLNTVNKNVHLVRLWFSRAEVSVYLFLRMQLFNDIIFL